MLRLEDAQRKLVEHLRPLASLGNETLALENALGRVCAQSRSAGFDLPSQMTSAMDGIAFGLGSGQSQVAQSFQIAGTCLAGEASGLVLQPGQAAHITTGAALPAGADTVCPQEHTIFSADRSHARLGVCLAPGANVRQAGEDFTAGAPLLKDGEVLHAARIALLAAFGYTEVTVSKQARSSVLTIGSELISNSRTSQPGQVNDVNGPMLVALLKQSKLTFQQWQRCADRPSDISRALLELSASNDLLITAGGLAEGQADHVLGSLNEIGQGERLMISLRPGKRLGLGKVGQCLVVCLPGTPSAALVNFLGVVQPALDAALTGQTVNAMPLQAKVSQDWRKHAGRTELHRVFVRSDATGTPWVDVCGPASPSMLHPWREANALMILHHDQGEVKAGDWVRVMML